MARQGSSSKDVDRTSVDHGAMVKILLVRLKVRKDGFEEYI